MQIKLKNKQKSLNKISILLALKGDKVTTIFLSPKKTTITFT